MLGCGGVSQTIRNGYGGIGSNHFKKGRGEWVKYGWRSGSKNIKREWSKWSNQKGSMGQTISNEKVRICMSCHMKTEQEVKPFGGGG